MDRMGRAGELRDELMGFSQEPRFDQDLRLLVAESFPDGIGSDHSPTDEALFTVVLDNFLYDHRFADGDMMIDRFVAAHRDLSDHDREMLLSWRESVQGVFELMERAGADGFSTVNLIDKLPYRIRSSLGAEGVAQLAPGMFVITRVVPVGPDWLIIGVLNAYGADDVDELSAMAAEFAMKNPGAVLRNPEKLAEARRLQAEQRDSFIELFGSDLIVVPGHELRQKLMEFFRFDYERKGGTAGGWTDPRLPLPPSWTGAESVGMIYDLDEGLGFYADFAAVQEVFADPDLVVRQRYRDVLTGYLRSEEIGPVPIRRLAEQDAGKADQVFRKLLRKPDFSWPQDGEALLRKYKPGYFDKPPLPRVMPAPG